MKKANPLVLIIISSSISIIISILFLSSICFHWYIISGLNVENQLSGANVTFEDVVAKVSLFYSCADGNVIIGTNSTSHLPSECHILDVNCQLEMNNWIYCNQNKCLLNIPPCKYINVMRTLDIIMVTLALIMSVLQVGCILRRRFGVAHTINLVLMIINCILAIVAVVFIIKGDHSAHTHSSGVKLFLAGCIIQVINLIVYSVCYVLYREMRDETLGYSRVIRNSTIVNSQNSVEKIDDIIMESQNILDNYTVIE